MPKFWSNSLNLTIPLEGKVDPFLVRDKIVLVGMTATSVPDNFHTPLIRGNASEEKLVRGITLHGQLTSQLIRAGLDGDTPLENWSDHSEEAWVVLWSLLGGLLWLRIWSAGQFCGMVGSGLFFLVMGTYWAFVSGWWIPVVSPAMVWIGSSSILGAFHAYQAQKEKKIIVQLFNKSVSKEVVQYLYQQRNLVLDDGYPRPQELSATVLFSDLQGFTPTAEKMTPGDLLGWLNDYFENMVKIIMKHQGIVDDYYGDAIKADFGIPIPRKSEEEIRQDAINAVLCSIEMAQELEHMNERLSSPHRPQLGMRVGIFTGTVVAGCVGSKDRMKYTTIGDAVNIAARLESFAKVEKGPKQLGVACRVLIGESTHQSLPPDIPTEWFGEVQLKGKSQRVKVYRVLIPTMISKPVEQV